jgi:hypothetical protein
MKRIGLGLLVSVLLLAGCGSGGGAVQGGQGPAEPGPPPATTRAVARAGSAGQPAAEVPQQLCSFLTTEVPRLKAKDSKVARIAGFAVDYTRWVAEDRSRALESASELDAISLARCPTVRREVLGVLARDSLSKDINR